MQIEELRLGNLVEANTKGDDGVQKWTIIKVSGIQKSFKEDEPDKVYFIEPDIATFNIWRLFTTTENDCLRPIPLTEEWLLKFGFEKQENNWKRLCICNDWTYIYWERLVGIELSVNKHSVMQPHIKSVHQLQNLYFALTQEELTLKTN